MIKTVHEIKAIIWDLKRQLELMPSLTTDYYNEDYINQCKKLRNAIEYLEMLIADARVDVDEDNAALKPLKILEDSSV